ncbi:hypothetical protein [Kushneria phosphatilytica]|uniref:Uncharacterized protein n=1 Tax=Kushneria phosphatilytica TaxID=657387 RepID=A0A1S1NMG2_9GAMM|nr:hypothetical protein [Kushneria phosphatilytica]OHV08345.1 hypothetical protein BH688_13560 [Kushneria phosphatilytica]QEL09760.1 hypothetical protein FY550_00535 [Kushneria phosphatilytica]
MTPIRWLALLLLSCWLTGCALFGNSAPLESRSPVVSLGQSAARQVLDADDWAVPPYRRIILVAPPTVDASLPIEADRLRETLIRTLLAHADGPQILAWQPADGTPSLADNQRILSTRLTAPSPALHLSDRTLYPYRLTLSLTSPTAVSAGWEQHIDGAFDADALLSSIKASRADGATP